MINKHQSTHQPLPQEINGRWQAFLFGISISLISLVVGGGIIWSGLEQTGFELALWLFFGLWPLFISGIFLYLSFYFTWRLTLLPDKIVIRHPFHKNQFMLDSLQAIRLVKIASTRSHTKDSAVLMLTFANGRSHRIIQQEMSLPLPHLFEMMVFHYQLSLSFEKVSETVHHTQFGAGSRRPFTHYLEGESCVAVHSIEEICSWLKECQYMRDTELFNQRDVWQHPGQFEKLQKGDCEDHALWAWRKLTELNISAEFVVGRANWSENRNGAHAWVTYEENGRSYILEATHKRQLIYAQEAVQERYHPWFSVDQNLQTHKFLPIAVRGVLSEKQGSKK
jgi:hypothetical protein